VHPSKEGKSPMKTRIHSWRWAAATLAGALMVPAGILTGLSTVGVSPAGASITADVHSAGTVFVPIQPCRLIDTVPGSGFTDNGETLVPGDESITTPDLHHACGDQIPSAHNLDAIVINLTAVNPSSSGFLTAYGAGQPQPRTSTVNFVAGQTIANQATIATTEENGTSEGLGGEITVTNYQGSVDVIVDVQGYYTSSYSFSGGALHCDNGSDLGSDSSVCGAYYPLTPTRVVDTRNGSGEQLANETLGPDSQINFLPGDEPFISGGLLPDNATAVVLNVTAVDPSAASFLTVWGTGTTQPATSNLNFPAGTTIANRVIVPLGNGGEVSVLNWAGSTNVVVDLDGYFANNETEAPLYCADPAASTCTGALYFPIVTPERISDTRANSGYEDANQTFGPGEIETVDVPSDSCGYTGPACLGPGFGPYYAPDPAATYFAPSAFVAADVNLTVTDTTGSSFLTAYPANDEHGQPLASDLNWVPGDIISNGDLVSTGTSNPATAIEIYNYAGTADVVVDLYGYYGTSLPPATPAAPLAVVDPATCSSTTTGTADVSWSLVSAPPFGGPVTYTVTPYDLGTSPTGTPTAGTPVTHATSPETVSGLTLGDYYQFTITAKNDEGSTTSPLGPTPPLWIGCAPAAPTAVTPTVNCTMSGLGGISVAFTPAAAPAGGDVTYEVNVTDTTTSTTTDDVVSGTSSPITVPDASLTAGDTYTFTVTALNPAGSATSAASSPAVAYACTPAAPTIDSVVPVMGAYPDAAMVAFTPGADGGCPITSYEVTATDTGGGGAPLGSMVTATGTTSPITISGLSGGDTYTFTMTETNCVDTSAASSPAFGAPGGILTVDAPAAPTITSAVSSFGAPSPPPYFTLGVTPGTAYGCTITGYTVTATDIDEASGDYTSPLIPSDASTTSVTIQSASILPGDFYTFTMTENATCDGGVDTGTSNASAVYNNGGPGTEAYA